MTWKVSGLLHFGRRDLNDGQANGFDAIVPNQQFAGGGFLGNPALADRGLLNNAFAGGGINFLNREPIPLTGTGLLLFGPNSLMPTMRAGLFEGPGEFRSTPESCCSTPASTPRSRPSCAPRST